MVYEVFQKLKFQFKYISPRHHSRPFCHIKIFVIISMDGFQPGTGHIKNLLVLHTMRNILYINIIITCCVILPKLKNSIIYG